MRAKDIKVEFKRANGYKVMVVGLPNEMRVLSTTILNGGFTMTDTIAMVQVPLDYVNDDPEEDAMRTVRELGLPERTVTFMTAADMEKVVSVVEMEYKGSHVVAIATAGVKNAVYAGELIPDHIKAQLGGGAHTINIMVIMGSPLHDIGMTNAIITATEAKSAALMDCGVRGTGTTSDAVAITCPVGDGEKYAGTATDAGICLARAVRMAVKESTLKWYARTSPPDFVTLLDDQGITVDAMWDAARKLIFPNENWSEELLRQKFMHKINVLRQDVNVNALVHAAILLEDKGNRNELHGLDGDRFKQDPVHLLADEVLGIGLAEYLTGTKGVFEYIRYDRKKPGILGDLGPFLDDIVGSLIGSVMSMIYSELLEVEGSLQ
ncbi:MAG: bifunctional adenosylcobinamide hydrolase/alpha-ribazole phosphatase CbiS [Methanomassiliicoccales archaeon]|nr:MAG: bifunctional adenosylcobinamide hydrolase/alpha-ribazole phosphatase CbiS [Methanomassiliicoccales archaeon]